MSRFAIIAVVLVSLFVNSVAFAEDDIFGSPDVGTCTSGTCTIGGGK